MSKGFLLKGIPSEVSEYIEFPNMAELLLYPHCMDIDVESFLKHATEFQKHLISKVPLKNDKRFVSVLSQVRILTPETRSCTGYDPETSLENEWHIDYEDGMGGENHIYQEVHDRVHLITNEVTSMTEFIDKDTYLDIDKDMPYPEFMQYIRENRKKLGIGEVKMPANRFVTFENHMHRATPSTEIEFKYMMRVVESNRPRDPQKLDLSNKNHTTVKMFDPSQGGYVPHLERDPGQITIYLPNIKSDMIWSQK